MTLNQFFNTYRSEDTESFNKIVDSDYKKYKEQYWWLFKAQQNYEDQQLALEDQSKDKLKNMISGLEQKQLVFNKHEIENCLYFNPKHLKTIKEGLDMQQEEQQRNQNVVIANTRMGYSILDEPSLQQS